MNFFNPTTAYKELRLLELIEKDAFITQKTMSEQIDAAPSMVNVYIERLEAQDFLKRNYQSLKSVSYHITAQGLKHKQLLLIRYMKQLMDLYQVGEASVLGFLFAVQERKVKNVLLYGAGEVAEIMIKIIRFNGELHLNIVGIVDDDPNKVNTSVHGVMVYTNEALRTIAHDVVVITTYTYEQDILAKLKQLNYPAKQIVRFFELVPS